MLLKLIDIHRVSRARALLRARLRLSAELTPARRDRTVICTSLGYR